jgi:hypothetical protein
LYARRLYDDFQVEGTSPTKLDKIHPSSAMLKPVQTPPCSCRCWSGPVQI